MYEGMDAGTYEMEVVHLGNYGVMVWEEIKVIRMR
jgi:hypothetical protein